MVAVAAWGNLVGAVSADGYRGRLATKHLRGGSTMGRPSLLKAMPTAIVALLIGVIAGYTLKDSARPAFGQATTKGAGKSATGAEREVESAKVSVRYLVDDVDAAITFYTKNLGFRVDLHPGPGFASLSRGNLALLLSVPGTGGGAGQAMPDGRKPEPGGWNRIQLEVADLAKQVKALREAKAHYHNDIVSGNGGKQILLDDPAGNPIELFEPRRR